MNYIIYILIALVIIDIVIAIIDTILINKLTSFINEIYKRDALVRELEVFPQVTFKISQVFMVSLTPFKNIVSMLDNIRYMKELHIL